MGSFADHYDYSSNSDLDELTPAELPLSRCPTPGSAPLSGVFSNEYGRRSDAPKPLVWESEESEMLSQEVSAILPTGEFSSKLSL